MGSFFQVSLQCLTLSLRIIFQYRLDYTRRQINQNRMIFGDFSVNSTPISFKFCKLRKIIYRISKVRPFDM